MLASWIVMLVLTIIGSLFLVGTFQSLKYGELDEVVGASVVTIITAIAWLAQFYLMFWGRP